MEIAIISPVEEFEMKETIVIKLFENGLQKFHLRKPDSTIAQLHSFLKRIPEGFRQKIILHQFPQLLDEFELGGFHITHHYKNQIQEIHQKISKHQSFSISTHSFDEIKNHSGFDYFFISPIFQSISKQYLKPAFTNEAILTGIKNNAEKKIYALGGVDESNIQHVKSMGFAGAALLGAIWQAENPVETFKQIQKIN